MNKIDEYLFSLENKVELAQTNLSNEDISNLVMMYQSANDEDKARIVDLQTIDQSLYQRKIKDFMYDAANRAKKEASTNPWRLSSYS